MSTNTGSFGELLYPGLYKIWGDAYNQLPEEYSRFMEMRTSTKAYEKTLGMTGLGMFQVKSEGNSVSFDDPLQGFTHTVTNVTYGLGVVVTREMYDDDQYGKINAMPSALARSARHTIETLAANVINNATTTGYTGADGLTLGNAAHLTVNGGTYSNMPSVASDLSLTSLEQAIIDIGNYRDDQGLLIAAKPKLLLVPTAGAWSAAQLLESTLEPNTNHNAVNPAKGIMPFFVSHYITDSDSWAIITDVPNGLFFQWRRKPDFTKDNDFDTENAKFKAIFRAAASWDDPRGIYYSAGA